VLGGGVTQFGGRGGGGNCMEKRQEAPMRSTKLNLEGEVGNAWNPPPPIKALLRLYSGSIQALFRLHSGSIRSIHHLAAVGGDGEGHGNREREREREREIDR
jgi:hypothetical protein